MKKVTALLLSLFIAISAFSTNYYCNPTTGNMGNDGSLEHPWTTLQAVFLAHKEFVAGDTVFLYSGDHGKVNLYGKHDDYTVIAAVPNEKPVIKSLMIQSASYWKFVNLHIADFAPEGSNVYTMDFLVESKENTDHIFFDRCSVYTTDEEISNWTRMDWFEKTSSGFLLKGEYSFIHNCMIKNTNFAIEIRGRYTEVINDTIENFVGDAIRALSSYSKYEYNVVMNSYDITGYNPNWDGSNPDYPIGGGNHDDLFQSYAAIAGGVEDVVRGVLVKWNKFISYTNPSQIDKSYTQGMGCFDGYFADWEIENNLIVTDSWHGITFLGIDNSVIANNTVINNPVYNDLIINGTLVNNMTPWIWVGKMKDAYGGGPSTNNTVRNNLIIQSKAGFVGNKSIIDDGINTTLENNNIVPANSTNQYFVNYEGFDLHLKSGSPAINDGININLPEFDMDKNSRLIGPLVDCGIYEFNDGSSTNNCPVIEPISNQSTYEEHTLNVEVASADEDGNHIALSTSSLPEFMLFVDNGDGTGVLKAEPKIGDMGNYTIEITATDGINYNKRTFTVVVAKYSGTGYEKKNNLLKLYPNPVRLGNTLYVSVNDQLRVKPSEIKIFNTSGILIHKERYDANHDSNVSVNTSILNHKGAYVLSVSGYNKVFYVY